MVTRVLPMFPLGTVLVPRARLPLHIFEPRYTTMMRVCMDGDREFGTVLIERGSEVGGGDTRFNMGTIAHIDEASELPDGRWVVEVVGTMRVRVVQWLPDDPYPRAEVEVVGEIEPGPSSADLRAHVEERLRRLFALLAKRAGHDGAPDIALDGDARLAAYQVMALPLVGDLDTYQLLELPSSEDRLARLIEILDGALEIARRPSGDT